LNRNKLKKNTVKIVTDNEKCTGCFLCYNLCPTKVIHMEIDKDGFYSPIIDFDKCNYCGRCYDNCPTIYFENTNRTNPKIYSGWTKNEYYLANSSSGGIFPELSEYFISKFNGIVFGAAWEKFPNVRHVGVKKTSDIIKMMSSKYVQSEIGMTYSDIKKLCKVEEYVLFSGTPCQVAGLNNLVRSDKLFTVEVLCHGIPSSKVFHNYIVENDIIGMNFREKKKGWENFYIRKNSSDNNKNRYKYHRFDSFFYGYLQNMYLQEICYSCPFSKLPRVGDITLGDYWGINKNKKNAKGTSLIVSNNNKGDFLLEKLIQTKLVKLETSSLADASIKNPRLVNGNLKIPRARKEILNKIDTYGFEDISKEYFFNKKTVAYEIIRRIYKKIRNIL